MPVLQTSGQQRRAKLLTIQSPFSRYAKNQPLADLIQHLMRRSAGAMSQVLREDLDPAQGPESRKEV